MDILQSANQPQRQAITSPDEPVMIVAGPGTGKTKTLTARIAYLLQRGVPPQQIVALTFTNKAAREMTERVAALVDGKKLPVIATFHALCLAILQEYAPDQSLQFATDSERADAIRRAIRNTKANLSARDAGLAISRAKGAAIPEQHADLVAAYNAALAEHGLIDFDDLLLLTHDLLTRNAKVREQLHQRYRHVLVDEFQDTSKLQWQLVRLLRGSDSVFVIGDPKQSIYSFRGANQDMFAVFAADFPTHQRITLETNYRSRPQIVQLANAVFPESDQLAPHHTGQGVVQAIQTLNEFTEADAVLSSIEQGIGGSDLLKASADSAGNRLSDFAIIYRTHRVARHVQQRLRDSGIPYQIVGEGSPYERPQLQAIVQSLRWLHTKDVLPRIAGFTPAQVQVLLENIELTQPVSLIAGQVSNQLGIVGADASAKADIAQLIGTLVRFDAQNNGLAQAVAYLNELESHDFYDAQADAVTLLTIHASKGLEFSHVLLIGAEEGILPHTSKTKTPNIPEEQRLFYVAATRARDCLTIFYAKKRAKEPAELSRFAAAIPDDILPRTVDPGMKSAEKRIQRRVQKARQTTLF